MEMICIGGRGFQVGSLSSGINNLMTRGPHVNFKTSKFFEINISCFGQVNKI